MPVIVLDRFTQAKAVSSFFFLNDPPPTEIYPFPLPDALPISRGRRRWSPRRCRLRRRSTTGRSRFLRLFREWELRRALQDRRVQCRTAKPFFQCRHRRRRCRSEEHTSELQSPCNLVCRLLLEK